MKVFKILFLIGPDRPGIVDDVTKLLFKHSCNLEDSRMAALGGCFSIMALFSCEERQIEALQSDLEALRALGFDLSVHQAQDPVMSLKDAAAPLKIEIDSMDHPGIAQEVVHLLHTFDINIHSLDTHVTAAPLSGVPLFHLVLEAEVPPKSSMETVRAAIQNLAEKMDLDLRFTG